MFLVNGNIHLFLLKEIQHIFTTISFLCLPGWLLFYVFITHARIRAHILFAESRVQAAPNSTSLRDLHSQNPRTLVGKGRKHLKKQTRTHAHTLARPFSAYLSLQTHFKYYTVQQPDNNTTRKTYNSILIPTIRPFGQIPWYFRMISGKFFNFFFYDF